eukprot:NODE_402_length_1737_cov_97.395142_g296_i0.p1 GENE.NODE_402_length_1737_cov_97.395142_g296_i0~~NODE_402_length_1737_cov_97.395142_g296_i0.p1  ORF type:complete len:430 (-),score=100.35 NODE_402_length_1737_cov_97.395142_g296_i0:251-1540(-)
MGSDNPAQVRAPTGAMRRTRKRVQSSKDAVVRFNNARVADVTAMNSQADETLLTATRAVDGLFEAENILRKKVLGGVACAESTVGAYEEWALRVAMGSAFDPQASRMEVHKLFAGADVRAQRWRFLDKPPPIRGDDEFNDFAAAYKAAVSSGLREAHLNAGDDDNEISTAQPSPSLAQTGEAGEDDDGAKAIINFEYQLQSGLVSIMDLLHRKVMYASERLKANPKWREVENANFVQLKERAHAYQMKTKAAMNVLKTTERDISALHEAEARKLETITRLERQGHERDLKFEALNQQMREDRKQLLLIKSKDVSAFSIDESKDYEQANPPTQKDISLVYACIWNSQDNAGGIWNKDEEAMKVALHIFTDMARQLLHRFGGSFHPLHLEGNISTTGQRVDLTRNGPPGSDSREGGGTLAGLMIRNNDKGE